MKQGLGTQLRHIIELLDGAVLRSYEEAGLRYRPRYTPIVKALIELEECTIKDLAESAGITQPAATQTVKMMVKEKIIRIRKSRKDSRQRLVSLTNFGQELLPEIQQCWQATNLAADGIEKDLGFSLSQNLEKVIQVLSDKSFDDRIRESRQNLELKQKQS